MSASLSGDFDFLGSGDALGGGLVVTDFSGDVLLGGDILGAEVFSSLLGTSILSGGLVFKLFLRETTGEGDFFDPGVYFSGEVDFLTDTLRTGLDEHIEFSLESERRLLTGELSRLSLL